MSEGTDTTDPQEFDAITGATITSTAVQNILNKTLEQAPEIVAVDFLRRAARIQQQREVAVARGEIAPQILEVVMIRELPAQDL